MNNTEQRSCETKCDATNYTILIVEDDLLTLEMMGLLLGDAGYDIEKASGFTEALQIVENKQIDLVISDIGLPDGDALAMMRTLRDRYGVPGISVSGYAGEADMREAGFIVHVTKPVEFSMLLEHIEKVRHSPRYSLKEREARILPFV